MNVSDKKAFLKAHIASIFPPVLDNFIRILHEELGLSQETVIPTFFADTVGDGKDVTVTLFTIGDSWRCRKLIAPIIIARLARFLGKDVKKEDLPNYYLAGGYGIWRKPGDPFFVRRMNETFSGKRPVAME